MRKSLPCFGTTLPEMSEKSGHRGTERKAKVIITAETKDSGRKRERQGGDYESQKNKTSFFCHF